MKHITRDFRRILKAEFDDCFGRARVFDKEEIDKHKKDIKDLFTGKIKSNCPKVPVNVYNRNEYIFLKLILNTFENK